jgi:hypothetical protein
MSQYAEVEPIVESCSKDSCDTKHEDPVVNDKPVEEPTEEEPNESPFTAVSQPTWVWAIIIALLIALGWIMYKKFI